MSISWVPSRNSNGDFILNLSGIKDPLGLRARLVGSHFATITAGQSADIDWQIPQLAWLGQNKHSYFDGIEYCASAELGDKITFQVVDVDGISYPAGTVLEEFGTNVYVMPNAINKVVLYKAKLIVGMYLRLKYTSTGSTDVKIACNIFRHLAENENV